MTSTGVKSALSRLRIAMQNHAYVSQTLQAYVIPSNDAHQSEYTAVWDQRRAYVSRFTGSLGTAVVTDTMAALWTDGRYFLQAEKELDSDWILMKDGIPDTPCEGEWLSKVLPVGSLVGVDPFLLSYKSWKKLEKKLKSSGHKLVPVNQNLVDVMWHDRPSPPNDPLTILPLEYAGKSWVEKIKSVRNELRAKNVVALVITALDEIAWLFNLRGSDVQYNPVFFAYAIVTLKTIHLFIDESKLTQAIKKELQSSDGLNVEIHSYNSISNFLHDMYTKEKAKIWISNCSSYALVSLIPKTCRVSDVSPVAVEKAIKNEKELKCMKNAHVKDAVALCEFFSWLESNLKHQEITEISAAEKLEQFRKLQKDYVGLSFETISACGPNASIIHYRPQTSSDRTITENELYLCDSGAQYLDGTTDVTRTWHFGVPSDYEKQCYTRVLKGHIALSSAVFPQLCKGQRLDTLARKSLWDVGLDYLHGTSHGVGMYLNVHEGPVGISYRPHPDDPGLQEGMILSIEPGFYEDNQFGIRIENLASIVKAKTEFNFRNTDFLTFEPLTLVPLQLKLLVPSLLTSEEIKWLNDYHVKCREVIGAVLKRERKTEALKWLRKETIPLG